MKTAKSETFAEQKKLRLAWVLPLSYFAYLGDGIEGKTIGIGSNCFLVADKLNYHSVAHELGHCARLDEFYYNLMGITNADDASRKKLIDERLQKNNSNVMGYSGNGYEKPKLDFFSWQIQIIRDGIINNRK